MAQYSSNCLNILDGRVVANMIVGTLTRSSEADYDMAQRVGLKAASAVDLATLDAWVAANMPAPWAAWWARGSDEEREMHRRTFLL